MVMSSRDRITYTPVKIVSCITVSILSNQSHRPESLFWSDWKILKRKRLKQNRREYSIGFRIWSPSLINEIDTFYNQQHP